MITNDSTKIIDLAALDSDQLTALKVNIDVELKKRKGELQKQLMQQTLNLLDKIRSNDFKLSIFIDSIESLPELPAWFALTELDNGDIAICQK